MAQRVNIYIETSCKGPAVRRAAGAWLVEYTRKTGEVETRGGILYADKAAENGLTLQLIYEAFSILIKPCECRVFTECRHVLNAMRNGWVWQWKENNWMSAKKTAVKNVDAWKTCTEVIGQHETEWMCGTHGYRILMQRRIIQELELEHALQRDARYITAAVPEWNTQYGAKGNVCSREDYRV